MDRKSSRNINWEFIFYLKYFAKVGHGQIPTENQNYHQKTINSSQMSSKSLIVTVIASGPL